MAVHLVLIACLAAPPNTCQEIPLVEVTAEDVVSCTGKAKDTSEAWQKAAQGLSRHRDQMRERRRGRQRAALGSVELNPRAGS